MDNLLIKSSGGRIDNRCRITFGKKSFTGYVDKLVLVMSKDDDPKVVLIMKPKKIDVETRANRVGSSYLLDIVKRIKESVVYV